MLHDINTVADVAAHWQVSIRTMRRIIARGAIPCFRLNGAIRIRRDDVLEYERKCTNYGGTGTASGTSGTEYDLENALRLGLVTAGRQKFFSPGSLPQNQPSPQAPRHCGQYLQLRKQTD